jgi:hypothetical protein
VHYCDNKGESNTAHPLSATGSPIIRAVIHAPITHFVFQIVGRIPRKTRTPTGELHLRIWQHEQALTQHYEKSSQKVPEILCTYCPDRLLLRASVTERREQSILHHDNAPSHTLQLQSHLSSSRRKAYLSSPNHHILRISLRVTFGFSYSENGPQEGAFRMKMGLKRVRFASMKDIKSKSTAELRKSPKEAFRRFFQQ